MVSYRSRSRIQDKEEKESQVKQGKLLEFIKQWKAIERRRKDLDYDEARWCHDLRSEFPGGTSGDKAFGEWLSLELGLPEERRRECLSRAAAFAILPDQHGWEQQGGYRQIRFLIPLDKRERVAVLGAAKASGYRISTVMRQRESRPIEHAPTPDIVLLAEFIEQLDGVPDELREVARRYVRAKALKVAA
jgi:hypothetical protein